jgi:ABC-type molybdate transport system substrate-binding protein
MPVAFRFCLAALLLVAGAGQAGAWTSPVPDIVVYCQPSLMHALTMIGGQYRASRHVKVHIFEAESASIDGLVAHMARDDVVVSDAATIDRLAVRNLVQKQPQAVLGLDRYVLVGRPSGGTKRCARSLIGICWW